MDESGVLRQLDDDRQIRNLLARLSHLADHGSIDEYLDLWLPDGVWVGTADTCRGREQLRARVESYREMGIQGPGAHTRHVSTTHVIEFLSVDRARADSYFLFFTHVDSEPVVERVGRYTDVLERSGGTWLMARRDITLVEE